MRRFVLVFPVTQAEFDDRRFFQSNINIITTLRRCRCVLIVVRETQKVFCVSEFTYQPSVEPGIRQMDFDAPREVTDQLSRFTELVGAIALNSQDKSVRYFGRTLDMEKDETLRFYSQLEIAP